MALDSLAGNQPKLFGRRTIGSAVVSSDGRPKFLDNVLRLKAAPNQVQHPNEAVSCDSGEGTHRSTGTLARARSTLEAF